MRPGPQSQEKEANFKENHEKTKENRANASKRSQSQTSQLLRAPPHGFPEKNEGTLRKTHQGQGTRPKKGEERTNQSRLEGDLWPNRFGVPSWQGTMHNLNQVNTKAKRKRKSQNRAPKHHARPQAQGPKTRTTKKNQRKPITNPRKGPTFKKS